MSDLMNAPYQSVNRVSSQNMQKGIMRRNTERLWKVRIILYSRWREFLLIHPHHLWLLQFHLRLLLPISNLILITPLQTRVPILLSNRHRHPMCPKQTPLTLAFLKWTWFNTTNHNTMQVTKSVQVSISTLTQNLQAPVPQLPCPLHPPQDTRQRLSRKKTPYPTATPICPSPTRINLTSKGSRTDRALKTDRSLKSWLILAISVPLRSLKNWKN